MWSRKNGGSLSARNDVEKAKMCNRCEIPANICGVRTHRKAKKQTMKRVNVQAAEGRCWPVFNAHKGEARGRWACLCEVPYVNITREKQKDPLSHAKERQIFSPITHPLYNALLL